MGLVIFNLLCFLLVVISINAKTPGALGVPTRSSPSDKIVKDALHYAISTGFPNQELETTNIVRATRVSNL